MDLYRQFARRTGGVRTPYNPTGVTVTTYPLVGGAAIEAALVALNDGVVGRFRVATDNLLYVTGTRYRAAWRKTANGYTYTKTTVYEHATPGAGTVPSYPAVGLVSVTDTTATFSNTLGTDSTETRIVCSANGATGLIGLGSGAYITVIGLTPGTTYEWGAEALNASGTSSLIYGGNLGQFSTARSLTIDEPLLVKFFVNGEDTQHINSPREIDIANEKGGFTVGDDRAPLGQGTVAVFLLENNFGNWWGMMDVTIRYREPEQAPFGIGSRSRDR